MNMFYPGAVVMLMMANAEAGFIGNEFDVQGARNIREDQNGSAVVAHTPTERFSWDIADRTDVLWLAVVYQEGMVHPPNPSSESQPVTATNLGQACGGVLVAPNKVLTLCACMRSFYLLSSGSEFPEDKAAMDILAANIYVTFWSSHASKFIADKHYVLNTQPRNNMPTCFKQVQEVVETKRKELLQTLVAVMLFEPEIKDVPPISLMPLLPSTTTSKFHSIVYGMSKKDKSLIIYDDKGMIFDPEKNVEVNLLLPNLGPSGGANETQCPYSDYCKKGIFNGDIPKEYMNTMRCVCLLDPKFQLCQGLPGFPVTVEGKLVGIMATSMDCKSGTQMVLLFDTKTVTEINRFLHEVRIEETTKATTEDEEVALTGMGASRIHKKPTLRANQKTPSPARLTSSSVTLSPAMAVQISILISQFSY